MQSLLSRRWMQLFLRNACTSIPDYTALQSSLCKAVVLIYMCVWESEIFDHYFLSHEQYFRPRGLVHYLWSIMLVFLGELTVSYRDMRRVTKLCKFTAPTFCSPSIFSVHKTVKSYRARVIRHTPLLLRVCSHWGVSRVKT